MSERYTSPELSRGLEEAGVNQAGPCSWCFARADISPRLIDPILARHHYELCPQYQQDGLTHARALDLTDVLHDLTRPRPEEADTRPLCNSWNLDASSGCRMFRIITFDDEDLLTATRDGATAVEAAGLVLLALLRERRGK